MALIGGLNGTGPPAPVFPSVMPNAFGPASWTGGYGGVSNAFVSDEQHFHPAHRPTPGGGSGGAPPHIETRLGVLGRQFVQHHPGFQNTPPPWWKAFHQAFFQSKAGDPRQNAISRFLGAHDPFTAQYTHFLSLLKAAGVEPKGGGGGGGQGAGQSYYLRPFYGYQQSQNPLAPPPVTPPPVYY